MAQNGGPASHIKARETNILALLQRTGYTIVQENGQRKYGPPPDWQGPAPPKGSEVFVGKLPRDLYEDELVPVFEKSGKVYEMRLMMDFSGSNRGFAFVMYATPSEAKQAIKDLDNYEIRKSRFIGVCKSVDNCRLFVGGIPKTKTKDEILNEMTKVTDGVVDVILYSSVTDKSKNRGFAFVEYESHRAAAMARRKLIPGKISLWGHEIAVDWAEPEPEVDEETMAKVTVLYVRNLMLRTTEDLIKDTFSLQNTVKVEKVKKLRDFAFVHYSSREDAQNVLDAMNKTQLDGSVIEVTWAKPVDRSVKQRIRGGPNQVPGPCNTSTYLYSQPSYEMYPGYSPVHFGYSSAPPPVAPVNRSTVVQRMSARGRGRGAAGLRGVRGYGTGFGRSATGYKRPTEHRYVDLQPNMELVPTNPYTLKPSHSSVQILQDMCQKNNWGDPQYHLHSTVPNDQNGESQLFVYKVTIPGLLQPPYNQFQPSKLCRHHEDAKQLAAEYILQQLGITPEGLEASIPQLMVPAPNGPGMTALSASPAYTPGRLGPMGFLPPPGTGYDASFYENIPLPTMY